MKTLFTDIDLTLLTDGKKLCDANRAALDKMISEGHRVVLTSGRAIDSVIKQANALHLVVPGAYCIAYNGAEIYDLYHQKTLHKSELSCALVEKLIAVADEYKIHIHAYDDEQVITRAASDELLLYCSHVKSTYKSVPNIEAYFRDHEIKTPKLLAIDRQNHDQLESFRQDILTRCGGEIDAFYSNPSYVEIVQRGTSKGVAVRQLCKILEIAHEDTVGAGDAMNDIPLLEAVHTACAVKNATDEVKSHADYVTTLDNNEGAVAEIIERFILHEDDYE